MNEKMTTIKNAGMKVAASAVLAMGVAFPSMAFAANGVQDAGTGTAGAYVYQEYSTSTDDGATATWTANDGTANPSTEYGAGGAINVIYDTTAGTWQDPGADATSTEDNVSHPNGTYQVVIPTLIKYTGMNIGGVNTSDSYAVTVRGAIQSGKAVTVTADASEVLSTASSDTGITATTTQGKTSWSVDECFGSVNQDGSLSGTTCTDTIAMTGVAKASGTYTGSISYSSSCA